MKETSKISKWRDKQKMDEHFTKNGNLNSLHELGDRSYDKEMINQDSISLKKKNYKQIKKRNLYLVSKAKINKINK